MLLPLLYTMRRPGAFTEYGHRTAVRAIDDFTGQLRGGRDEYLFEMREFVEALYSAAGNGERYFLDKTPRYHLVIHEIMELFPDGKFIFLWRQPLAVAASIIESFGRGRWNLDRYAVDLEDGLEHLVAAARPNDPRCLTLRYEDVVADSEGELQKVFAFLGLDPAGAGGMSDDALRGADAGPGRGGHVPDRVRRAAVEVAADDGHDPPAAMVSEVSRAAGPGTAPGDGLRLRRARAPGCGASAPTAASSVRRRPPCVLEHPSIRDGPVHVPDGVGDSSRPGSRRHRLRTARPVRTGCPQSPIARTCRAGSAGESPRATSRGASSMYRSRP